MAQGRNELVKNRVFASATNRLDGGCNFTDHDDALIYFGIGMGHELEGSRLR